MIRLSRCSRCRLWEGCIQSTERGIALLRRLGGTSIAEALENGGFTKPFRLISNDSLFDGKQLADGL
jgi:hypothetical protein